MATNNNNNNKKNNNNNNNDNNGNRVGEELSDRLSVILKIISRQLNNLRPDEETDEDGLVDQVPDAPDAPKKNADDKPKPWIRKGLPRPFESRPRSRRNLFPQVEIHSPIPVMPQAPQRIRTKSMTNGFSRKRIARRCLDFETRDHLNANDVDQSANGDSSDEGEVYPVLSVPNAPKKRRSNTPSRQGMNAEFVGTPQAGPSNRGDDQNENYGARISTPASAPLPMRSNSHRRFRYVKRRSEGNNISDEPRKRLFFDENQL